MRLPILLLLLCCASSLAAPPSSSSSSSDGPSSTKSLAAPASTSSIRTSTQLGPHHPPKSGESPQLPTRPSPQFPPHATHTIHISPAATDGQQNNEHRDHTHYHSQKPIVIFFEVLGGLVGLAVVASCFRCCYIYNRTPKRDRIEAILERHRLERELAELERNPLALRRSATSDPLPAYFPPPPTYETVALNDPALASTQRSGYTEVATPSLPTSRSTSPTSSPFPPTRELESVPLEPPIPRPAIPSAPTG